MPREAIKDAKRDINNIPRGAIEDAKRGIRSCNKRH